MSDSELPKIPSLEDLGISPEELEELEREIDGPPEGDAGDETSAGPASAKSESGAGGKGGSPPPKPTKEGAGPSPSPTPFGGLRGPLTLLVLAGVAWMSSANRAMPSPVSASAPDSVFSSARAMTQLTEIARRPHPPGSPEHARVRTYLLEQLVELGLEPEVQTTTSLMGRGTYVRAATVRNIVARIPGTDSDGAVLVTAHYDGREIAPAAGDDGSGVVSILESLRALRAELPLKNDVIVLITDGEELGLLGARAFVDEHPWMDDVALVLSIEMRGGGGPSIMFETGENSGWVVDQFRQADPYPVATSLSYEIYKRLPNDTDFSPFKQAGKQGLNFAGIGRANVYHQAYDSPENLSESTLQHHGSHALAMLRQFGNADLSEVNGRDPVYFSVPLLGLVVYPGWMTWVLGALGLGLWVVALTVARKGGGRWKGVSAGLLGALLAAAGSGATGHFLYQWRAGVHPESGALQGSAFHSEGWYVLALVAVSFAIASLFFGLLRRWFSLSELVLGAMILPLAMTVGATVAIPMGAMVLQWPMIGGAIGALAVAGVGGGERLGVFRWGLAMVAAVPVLALLSPVIELLWISMNFSFAMVLGVLIASTLVLLLPVLEVSLSEPNRWWLPLAGVVLGAGFLGLGMLNTRPSAERPSPSTLVYLWDRGEGVAHWGTDPGGSADPDDVGVAWATGQVGAFDAELDWGTGRFVNPYAVAEAPVVEAPLPSVRLVADTSQPGRIRVAFRSEVGAEMMRFAFGEGGPELLAVNGMPRGSQEAPLIADHWGVPAEAVALDFDRASVGTTLDLELTEHLLRPEELLGAEPFQRPPDLAPNIRQLSDRAMIRTSVTVDLATGSVSMAGGGSVIPELDQVLEEPAGAQREDADGTGAEGAEADPALTTDSIDVVPSTADTARTDTTRVDVVPEAAAAPNGTSRGDTAATDTIPGR